MATELTPARILDGMSVDPSRRLTIERDGPACRPWRIKTPAGETVWVPTAGSANICLSFKSKAEAVELMCGMAGQWLLEGGTSE